MNRRLRRFLIPLSLAGATMALSAAPAAAAECPNADLTPTGDNIAQVEQAAFCLMNEERSAHGLVAVSPSDELRRSALGHTEDMVRRNFFDHVSPGGSTVTDRIRLTGYIPQVGRWLVGENLAWGSNILATPRAIHRGWMGSPAHRQNILQPEFRDAGIAVAPSAPVLGISLGATYATNFGFRTTQPGAASSPKTSTKSCSRSARARSAARRRACAARRCKRSRSGRVKTAAQRRACLRRAARRA